MELGDRMIRSGWFDGVHSVVTEDGYSDGYQLIFVSKCEVSSCLSNVRCGLEQFHLPKNWVAV